MSVRKELRSAADLFPDRCAALWKTMREAHPDKVAAADTSYSGLDGYRRILDDKTIDVVLITTSPGFRPRYVREAVEAGKHVFTEKPACVDPAGYRICLAAHDAAVAKGTAIVAGTQYRRQVNYVGVIDQIRAGKPIVEFRQMADSSLVAVMGRMAAYTGQRVTWKFVTEESQLDLFPKDLAWESALPCLARPSSCSRSRARGRHRPPEQGCTERD